MVNLEWHGMYSLWTATKFNLGTFLQKLKKSLHRISAKTEILSIYLSGLATAAAVFWNPNTIQNWNSGIKSYYPFKGQSCLTNIETLNSCLTENALNLNYKYQSFSDVWGNNHPLLYRVSETHKWSVHTWYFEEILGEYQCGFHLAEALLNKYLF